MATAGTVGQHAHEVKTSEDILADLLSVPYSNKVHTILLPEMDVLRRVLLQEDTADDIIPEHYIENPPAPALEIKIPPKPRPIPRKEA